MFSLCVPSSGVYRARMGGTTTGAATAGAVAAATTAAAGSTSAPLTLDFLSETTRQQVDRAFTFYNPSNLPAHVESPPPVVNELEGWRDIIPEEATGMEAALLGLFNVCKTLEGRKFGRRMRSQKVANIYLSAKFSLLAAKLLFGNEAVPDAAAAGPGAAVAGAAASSSAAAVAGVPVEDPAAAQLAELKKLRGHEADIEYFRQVCVQLHTKLAEEKDFSEIHFERFLRTDMGVKTVELLFDSAKFLETVKETVGKHREREEAERAREAGGVEEAVTSVLTMESIEEAFEELETQLELGVQGRMRSVPF